jgi:hypothetical protein
MPTGQSQSNGQEGSGSTDTLGVTSTWRGAASADPTSFAFYVKLNNKNRMPPTNTKIPPANLNRLNSVSLIIESVFITSLS